MKISRYLFLQGQISRFFAELGLALHRRGDVVHRIHFNRGDALFWDLPQSLDFAGTAAEWPDFFSQQLSAWGITDVVLFGDCRPLHLVAIRLARLRGVTVHVFEEGYLRPDFITLETGGVNGYSSLPRDAADYLKAARVLPPWSAPQPVPARFSRRAAEDVRYNLNAVAGHWRFPHYRSHRLSHPLAEYAVGLKRFPLKFFTRQKTELQVRAIEQGTRPYFVFPLQLDADSQIRHHAPAGGMTAAITQVLRSFVAHAAAEALLVVTEHPLDYGPAELGLVVQQQAAALGVGERVVYLRGGSPAALVNAAQGMVTVNSTIGITALAAGVPVVALGAAVYGVAGLTHQQGLDSFWHQPQKPDAVLFDAFRRVVAARTQINGGFYSAEGIALAVQGALQKLPQTLLTRAEIRYLPVAEAEPISLSPDWVPQPVAASEYTAQA